MPEVKGTISPFIGTIWPEVDRVIEAMKGGPLSGFIGGELRGGKQVRALEDAWAERFNVKHAITCNSATLGLMAAAFAVGLGKDSIFAVSPYTMSATAAAPMFTGATPYFTDVEDTTFCMNPNEIGASSDAVIITNLFGHPSQIQDVMVDLPNYCMVIEDNSQSSFAMERGCYAGTFGDIGIFSLNVHKHITCGEGGICVTDNAELADKLRRFINHGEMAGGPIGLNLRLTEVSATIALSQLERADELISERIEQAEAIIEAIGYIPGLQMPIVREGCKHVYYTIPFLLTEWHAEQGSRAIFVEKLKTEGVPLSEGYVDPLYRLPAFSKFAGKCPVAEDLHDRRLFLFENCAWSPTKEQIKQIGNAFKKVAEEMKL